MGRKKFEFGLELNDQMSVSYLDYKVHIHRYIVLLYLTNYPILFPSPLNLLNITCSSYLVGIGFYD
uniref:Uncharacterized protein n=1 Tax=Arundo donax TaxID=35708 RepID=A0A0A8YD12_ARUDO